MDKMIYHFSEEPDISYFEPRFSTPELGAVVWGLSEVAMYKYLLPRDCPRVTFRADDQTSARDVQLFFGHSSVRYVVAVESCWLETVRRTKLFHEDFRQRDPDEGKSATECTTFQVAYDDEALYFGIMCYDSEPDKIVAQLVRRDNVFVDSDKININLDPHYNRQSAYWFTVHPSGSVTDGIILATQRQPFPKNSAKYGT